MKTTKKLLLVPIIGGLILFLSTLAMNFADARSLTLQEEQLFAQLTAEANATLASDTATAQEKEDARITLQQITDRLAEIRLEEESNTSAEVQRMIREAAALINKNNPTEDDLKEAKGILERASSRAEELEGAEKRELKQEIDELLRRITALLNKPGDDEEDRNQAQQLLQQVLQKLMGARQSQNQIRDQIRNVGNNRPGGNTGGNNTGGNTGGNNTGGNTGSNTGGNTTGGNTNNNNSGGNNSGGNTDGPQVEEGSQVNTFDGENQGSGDDVEEFQSQCDTAADAKKAAEQQQKQFEEQVQGGLAQQAQGGQAVPVDTISINERVKNIEEDIETIKEYTKWLTKKEAGLSDNDLWSKDSLDALAYCYGVEIAKYQAEAAADWIYNVYNDNPSFIKDYPNFFQDSSDKATEEFLDDLKENSQCKSIDEETAKKIAEESKLDPYHNSKCPIEDTEEEEGTIGYFLDNDAVTKNSGPLREMSSRGELGMTVNNTIGLNQFELEQEYLISLKEEESEQIRVPARLLLRDALRRVEVPYDMLANFDENSEEALIKQLSEIFEGGPGFLYRQEAENSSWNSPIDTINTDSLEQIGRTT